LGNKTISLGIRKDGPASQILLRRSAFTGDVYVGSQNSSHPRSHAASGNPHPRIGWAWCRRDRAFTCCDGGETFAASDERPVSGLAQESLSKGTRILAFTAGHAGLRQPN